MAWGIIEWNDEYAICDTQHIKRFPNGNYIYIRKGECFPREPLYANFIENNKKIFANMNENR